STTAIWPTNIATNTISPQNTVPQKPQTCGVRGAGAIVTGGLAGSIASINQLSAARFDREIIGRSSRARQGEVPPFPPIVDKALTGHDGNQLAPPLPLLRRDGVRIGVALQIRAIVAGAHIDAAFRRAFLDRRGAIGVGPGGIEGGGIIGGEVDQRQIERGAGRMLRVWRDVAE